MRERLKNWYTTVIGAVMMLASLGLIYAKIFVPGVAITYIEITVVAILGWVFLMAKDTLLEGVLGGIFKLPRNNGNT